MSSKIQWLVRTHGATAPGAFPGGRTSTGQPMYIIRAAHKGGTIPGKLVPEQGQVFIPYDGQEIGKSVYEVLCCAEEGALRWVECTGGIIPEEGRAVRGGRDPAGDPYYVGRARFAGTVTVGKVHPNNCCLYISHEGKEHVCWDYQVLVEND